MTQSLLYVDPSPRGEWALGLAAALPAELTGGLDLLATAEDAARDPGLLSRARERTGASRVVEARSLPGPAERAIARAALERAYALALVPPAGRGAILRMLRGSRIASVVRSVPTSVLIARRPPARLERVLCAVSPGPRLRAVVRSGLDLGRALGAAVAFLHVVSEVALPYAPEREAGEPPDPLLELRTELLACGAGEPLVREGLVVDEVLAEVDSGAHHLLVIGAQLESAPGGFPRDDTTERLLLGSAASILVVRGTERAPWEGPGGRG
jgi:nucleotide-binding universal stress UspA family protein